MKTGAVYVYTGICLMILGGLWIYFFMNYNGYWFTFSPSKKRFQFSQFWVALYLLVLEIINWTKRLKKRKKKQKKKQKMY